MSAMLSQRQSVVRASVTSSRVVPQLRRGRVVANAEPEKAPPAQAPQAPPTPQQAPAEPAQPFKREFRSLGSQVIEQTESFEEPPAKDMWEGDNFEFVGKFLETYFLPVLVVLGLVCGGIAANSYNEDADVYVVNAPSDASTMILVPAGEVQSAPSPAA